MIVFRIIAFPFVIVLGLVAAILGFAAIALGGLCNLLLGGEL